MLEVNRKKGDRIAITAGKDIKAGESIVEIILKSDSKLGLHLNEKAIIYQREAPKEKKSDGK